MTNIHKQDAPYQSPIFIYCLFLNNTEWQDLNELVKLLLGSDYIDHMPKGSLR